MPLKAVVSSLAVIYLLLGYDKHDKFNKMPLKAVVSSLAVMISGQSNTSIAKSLDTNS